MKKGREPLSTSVISGSGTHARAARRKREIMTAVSSGEG